MGHAVRAHPPQTRTLGSRYHQAYLGGKQLHVVLLIPVILESLMRPVVIQFSEPHHWCGLEDRVIAHSSRDTPFLVTSDKGTLLVNVDFRERGANRTTILQSATCSLQQVSFKSSTGC